MLYQIKDFAGMAHVSVRTLHYYDEVGLLRPAYVDEHTGYRYYDESSILRMQEILFYRELDFPLKEIARIMQSEDYDRSQALKEQKQLLLLKKERLEGLINAIDDAIEGMDIMKNFDNSPYENYKEEVKKRWGHTDAYAEYAEKSKHTAASEQKEQVQGMDLILEAFARNLLQSIDASAPETQELVLKLQNHITEHYYTCTPQILYGLGQMYVADERFTKNIDKHAPGTAAYIRDAIEIYCQ